jgi:putative aldouronate transport system substrate-binding protein
MKRKGTIRTALIGAAGVLAVGTLLAACSKNEPEAPSGSPAGTKSAGDSTADAKRGSMSVTIYDRGAIPPEEGTYDNNRWTRWINEKGPVDVKFVPIPRIGSEQKIPVLFASGEAPDLVLEYDQTMRNQLWAQKQLMPLDDVIDKYSTEYKKLLEKYPQLKKVTAMPDGKIYQIAKVAKPITQNAMVIRKDWLDKLNLKVPETIEDFYQAAYAFAHQDPDGNGKKDTYGFNMNAHPIIDKAYGSELFIIENGELVRQFDRIKPAAEYKKKLFENDVVDKDFLTDKTGQKAEQDFANGKTGIFVASTAVIKKNYEILKKNDPNAVIIPIALPKTPFGQYSPDFSPPIDILGVVNAKTKDPKAVMQYIDFILQPSTVEMLDYGPDGVYYKKSPDGCPEPIDAEKIKKEVSYNGDYKMFMTRPNEKMCMRDGVSVKSTSAFDQEWIKIVTEMDKLYVDPSRPTPGYTHFKLRPNVEKDVNTTLNDGWNKWHDIVMKAVVSSGDLDKAVKEVKDAWYNSGGQKAEDWHKKWYQENKDKWVFMEDLYKMKVE